MSSAYRQQMFTFGETLVRPAEQMEPARFVNGDNTLGDKDKAFHNWYRFVLSFPPHLVRDYIRDFGLHADSVLLDPFCGTGTTLVEAQLNGITSVGIEANPFAHFATKTKVAWNVDPERCSSVGGVLNVAFKASSSPLN